MTRRRFRAARGWPCVCSRSSPRTCGCGTAPGTSCGSALSCSPCCGPSRTTRRARAPPTRERWPRRCTTIFAIQKPILMVRNAPRRVPNETARHGELPDVSLDDTPSGTNAPSVCVRNARREHTVVVLGAGAEDACRVVADRTATYGDASQTEDTSHVDAGEAFKKRGNAAFENGDYSTAIEAYGRAIDAPVSYRRLFDEAPRRAAVPRQPRRRVLAPRRAADAGAGACDGNGHLENATFPEEDPEDQSRLNAFARVRTRAPRRLCWIATPRWRCGADTPRRRFRRAVALWRLGRVSEARRDAERPGARREREGRGGGGTVADAHARDTVRAAIRHGHDESRCGYRVGRRGGEHKKTSGEQKRKKAPPTPRRRSPGVCSPPRRSPSGNRRRASRSRHP